MINSNLQLHNPPFYVAAAFEVFLRVAAPALLREYGSAFMQLLFITQKQLLPLLGQEVPRRQCLEEFLVRFLSSGGEDFMSLFQVHLE